MYLPRTVGLFTVAADKEVTWFKLSLLKKTENPGFALDYEKRWALFTTSCVTNSTTVILQVTTYTIIVLLHNYTHYKMATVVIKKWRILS